LIYKNEIRLLNNNLINMIKCSICKLTCNSEKSLKRHEKKCKKFSNIKLTCKICNTEISNISFVDSHQKTCKKLPVEDICRDSLKTELENYKRNLIYQQAKNRIYECLIKSNTHIKLNDLIEESDNKIRIFDFVDKKTEIILSGINNNIKYKEKPKCKRKSIKSVSDNIVLDKDSIVLDNNEEIDKKNGLVEKIDKDNIVLDNNEEIDKKNGLVEKIDVLIDELKNKRAYTPTLKLIKDYRKSLLNKLSIIEYTEMLNTHNNKLKHIFKNRQKSEKDIIKVVRNSLSTIDMRLIFYNGYGLNSIDIDDVQNFKECLNNNSLLNNNKLVPHSKIKVVENVKNYGLTLFRLKECIELNIINKYGFNSIIFINNKNNIQDNPYSFYILDNVTNKNKRKWKMECRLEDYVNYFIDNIKPYCINLFRKIYYDIFKDNIYRDDYKTKSPIMEFDCEQLFQNIMLLSKPIELCSLFQYIIKGKCSYTPDKNDKLDFKADDKMQKNRFEKIKSSNINDTRETITQLFDDIKDETVDNILLSI